MLEKLKKRTNTSIFKNNNKNTLQNEDFNIVLLSELWDPTVLSCYIWSLTSLFYVDFMDYLKPVHFYYIFPL